MNRRLPIEDEAVKFRCIGPFEGAPTGRTCQNGPVTEINLFKHATDAIAYEPGDVVFREGDAGDAMYAVVAGSVEVMIDGAVVEKLGPGGIIGELALIDTEPRSATAVASSGTRLVRIDQKQFTFLVQEHPTFAVQVMRVMAERLRRANHHA